MSIYDFVVKRASGEETSLKEFKGKVLLVVNTASRCGFTPQYEGLQRVYDHYKEKGFEVLAFPCNQFGHQEPGDNKEITEFCSLNFNTKFPIFEKVEVNGKKAHPLYRYLTKEKPGLFGTKNIKWNFTKFLVDKDGTPIKRYAPTVKPEEIAKDIEAYLN